MCGGQAGIYRGDQFSSSILNDLLKVLQFGGVKFDSREVYLFGVDSKTIPENLRLAIKAVNTRRKIFNIVEPNRDLTYLLIKENFTPYIEKDKIIWSFW